MDLAQLKKDALAIFQSGVEAAAAENAVERSLKVESDQLEVQGVRYDLSRYEGIYVVGAGKAAAFMGQAVEARLLPWIKRGLVNVKYGHGVPLRRIEVNEAGHPLPDEAGVRGTERIIQLLEGSGEKDLILVLISGGGSALLPCPVDGLTLSDKQTVTKMLLECGANIREINTIRKHLSLVKGGRLASLASPSTVVTLILSDVVGDEIDSIASGPTAPDITTYEDCLRIVERYGIRDSMPAASLKILEDGMRGELPETPKKDDPAFGLTHNTIIGNNALAMESAKAKAEQLGYRSLVLSDSIQGDAHEAAKNHASLARDILSTGRPLLRPVCVISGGETTVVVQGNGTGGRNQEFVLAAALEIEGLQPVVILSGGTDGTDGPTDAAGALADGGSLARARELGMDARRYLEENNAYPFFQNLGDLILTGPTHTNVMDLRLVLVG